ncbi:MAG: Ohr family peroxiredoxin [Burkholderiales bacterium]|nr:Ohr family peroxiredoxin [Opitutaceae bacterium]
MKDLYTAHVKVTGGRDGAAVSSDGHLAIKLGFPKELGGGGDSSNPEQLFVAGYAACFASTLKALAGARSVGPGPITIDAAGVLSVRDDGTYIVSRVTLTVHAPELGAAGPELVTEAKRFCAYSNATRGNVETSVVLV